jgi:hypothetical protein
MNEQEYPEFIDPQQYPDFWEQISNFKKFASEVGQNVVKGESVLCSEEIVQKRLDICNDCSQFNKESKRCYLCGCFMEHKIKFTSSACPASKW